MGTWRIGAVGTALVMVAAVVACTPPTTGGGTSKVTVSSEVAACGAALSMALDVTPAIARSGQPLTVGAQVRNDPSGTCTGTLGGTQVAGTVRLNAGSAAAAVDDVAMWLERTGTRTVLPTSSARTTSGSTAPLACPGGQCTSALEAVTGGVDLPSGLPSTIAAGAVVTVPFRFFPTLDAADLAAISPGSADLVVAVTVGGGVQLTRRTVTFSSAPAVSNVQASLRVGGVAQAARPIAGPIAPGGQVDLPTAWTYGVTDLDRESIELVGGATVAGASPAQASLVVPVAGAAPARLVPSASPDVVSTGVATPILITVAPVGAVTGALSVSGPGLASTLLDDGTGGDVVAGDGVYSRSASVTATSAPTYTVSGTVGGLASTGTVTMEVLPAGAPTRVQAWAGGPVVAAPTGEVLGNRIVLTMAPGTAYATVAAAATSVGGAVVGRVVRDVWQVRIPAVTTSAQLDAVLASVSGRTGVIGAAADGVATTDDLTPNDPRYDDQWGYQDINADDAWVFERRGVMVAVVDTGIDLDHPDLVGHVVGTGRDVVNDDDRAEDDDGHGTHVAGTIGAATNNGTDGAGMSWSAGLLPVKVLDDEGHGAISDIAAGIVWAVDRGARVINLSLGGSTRSEDYARAIDHAVDRNRVVVVAAGNDNCSERHYPAGFDRTERFTSWFGLNARTYDTQVISVGAVDRRTARSIWTPDEPECTEGTGSNFGDDWVDVAAPGSEILSTRMGGGMVELNGTSMATPHVAGLASLLLAQDRGMTGGEVRARIMSTATGRPVDSGLGSGLIDVFDATFNSGFESGGFNGWTTGGTTDVVTGLGSVEPQQGERMAMLSTGPDAPTVRSSLTKAFTAVPALLDDDRLILRFRYNYITEEFPEWVNSQYNDTFVATVTLADGTVLPVVEESVNTTVFTPVTGIDFPGGDGTVGASGWRTARIEIPAARLLGQPSILLDVSDRGDAIYDSVVLLDEFEVS